MLAAAAEILTRRTFGYWPMISLIVDRVDVRGSCRYKIESEGTARVTSDPVKAARILFSLGVTEPLLLVDHARQWGSVEIFETAAAGH